MKLKTIPTHLIIAISTVVLLCIYIWLSTKPPAEGKGRDFHPPLVSTVQPIIKDMPILLEVVGTVNADETVSIIAQVSGILKAVHIEEGQEVKAGDLLFELDPATYLANVAQARANLQKDKAQLALLNANTERYAALAKKEYVTVQQYDEAKSSAAAQKAMVAADHALLAQAKIQLEHAHIYSPIAGKVGAINVHRGDLITANSSPLLVINRLDPVLVSFNISQSRLPEVLAYQQKTSALRVNILKEDSDEHLAEGLLSFVNNNVDTQTGTVLLKAKVPNAQAKLWPGQLVSVQLILAMQPKAIVIPDQAVQLGQAGSYIFVLKEGKAVVQKVTVARQIKHEAVIDKGLEGNEIVISEVPPGLKDGSKVLVAKKPV